LACAQETDAALYALKVSSTAALPRLGILCKLPVFLALPAALSGCANKPILGMASGDNGVFFKRVSIGCVVGKSTAVALSDVTLSQVEVHPGDMLAHRVVIER
jgi:hypothetical protein